jgi:predicted secreted acid phosphatase
MLMLRNIFFIAIILSLLVSCSNQLTNLSHAKSAVKKYYESGEYTSDLKKIISEVKSEFETVNLTLDDLVIFDVDETSLSNYNYIKSIDFGYEYELWNDYLNTGTAEAISPILDLYNWFKAKNATVMFLTGREDITYKATKENLERVGFTNFDTLICRNDKTKKLSAEVYKSNERKLLTEKGFNIIANIGDLKSDHAGGYTGKIVKLPNYIYDF